MRKITVVLRDETLERFEYILKSRAERDGWQRIPSYKEIMVEAMQLLYRKERYGQDQEDGGT